MHYYPINITKVLNNQTIIIKNKKTKKQKKQHQKIRDCKSVAVWGFFSSRTNGRYDEPQFCLELSSMVIHHRSGRCT